MRIAQVVCVYPPYKSGISTSALETARVLSAAGHQVDTFTIDYGSQADDQGVTRLKALPRIGNGGFLPQLFWRLNNFDLIYLHYPFFGAVEIVWQLKKLVWQGRTKLVVHFHMEPKLASPFLKFLSWPSRLIKAGLFKSADRIICASRDYAEANLPAAIWTANQERIIEIPFAVDTERFRPIEPAQPQGGLFKLLFVGGLDKAHYFKGINVLLDSLYLLDKDNKDWQLEIVGEGDLRPEYEKRAGELGIADKVFFAGNVPASLLPGKYQAADCLVLPSINQGEAFGIVLIEAMASGLPVIASLLPGVRRVFTPESGLLIRPGDAGDLAEKIKYLSDNSNIRLEMGKAARREAEERYSVKNISRLLTGEIENLAK